MKKIITLLLVLVLGFSLVGCSGEESGTASTGSEETTDLTGKQIRILQFVSQTLGSLSCEDLVKEGIDEFCAKTGSTVKTVELNYDDTHIADRLNAACATGEYDLVVTGYWTMQEYVEQAAKDYPNIKFLTFDCTLDYEKNPEIKANTAAFLCQQNSLAFAAGALGALISESGKGYANPDKVIGFVGGGHVTAIDDFLIGYIQGAHYVDPDMKVLYSYVGDWENTGKAKELALDQYNNGADVSFGVCAPASFGVCEAAYEAKRYAFGVDTDHTAQLQVSHPEQAEYTVSSAIKQFGNQIRDALFTVYDGTIVWGQNINAGFESGYLTMADNDIFQEAIVKGMPEVYAEYEKIVADLLAGKIEVGTAINATPEYVAAELAKASITSGSN